MQSLLRVGKNAVARLAAQVWARLLSMVLVALVARYESAEGLGQYVLVLTVVSIAGAAIDLGLNVYLTREVAREPTVERQRELFGSALSLKIGFSALGAVGLVIVALVARFPEATQQLLPIGALLLFPEAAVGTMRAFVNGRQRMEVSGLIDMIIRLVAVAVSLPVLVGGFGVAGVLLATVGSTLVGILLYAAILLRWCSTPRLQWRPLEWLSHLRESYPFALTSIIAMVYARIDLLLLGLWLGESAAGWYGAAYKLWETAGLLPASLLEAMFPEMSRLSGNEAGLAQLRRLFRRGSAVLLAAGLALGLIGMLAAGPLVTPVYGRSGGYGAVVLPFQVLIAAAPALFLYLLSGHALYAVGQQRRVTVAMLVIGLVNIGLNLFVIPRWGFVGAAAVALVSEWLLLVLLYPQAARGLALSLR